MTHDIDDLLEIIKNLEERIIALESKSGKTGSNRFRIPNCSSPDSDSWYWEHG